MREEIIKTRTMAVERFRMVNTAMSAKDLVRGYREALGTVTDLCDILIRLSDDDNGVLKNAFEGME